MELLFLLMMLMHLFPSPGSAFWRMPCDNFPGAHRIDPIDTPGAPARHSHLIHGGLNFGMTTTYEDLRSSKCSSCQVPDDRSAYWVPSLHFQHADGTFEAVPQIGGILVYYLLRSGFAQEPIVAFPPGFRMIAGDSPQRTFNWPVPDPPTSFWAADDFSQAALKQKALGFNCLHYNNPPNEDTCSRHFLPDKAFIQNECYSGIRVELVFPSCWNGKDVDSPDHKSHVAYPSFFQSGSCPPDFPVRLPTLLYEVIFNSQYNKGQDGKYVFSNGDTTGFGNHGDFMSGWDPAFLQQAIKTCTSDSGRIEDCPLFKIQGDATAGACAAQFVPPASLAAEDCSARRPALCGNNPVFGAPPVAPPAAPAPPAKAPASPPPEPAPSPPPPSPPPSPPPPAPPVAPPPPPPPAAVPLPPPPPPPPPAAIPPPAPVPVVLPHPPPPAPAPVAPPAPLVSLPPPSPPSPSASHASTMTSMSNGVGMIVYMDETTVYEDVTTTVLVKRHAHHVHRHAH